ncbi:MAG: LytTR family DNA-binding domain-containing protein [Bacteroidota bacterium]
MSQTLDAILVEDEAASRETLRNYLSRYCLQVNLLAEAENVAQGLKAIHTHQPDLVFLDVEMPFGNAFDLLEQVENLSFETVFVTAFSHYALKALNASACHYLLKPIDIDELVLAVEKVQERIQQQADLLPTQILLENLHQQQQQSQKLVLPVLEGFELIKVEQVIRCQANGNMTDFFLTDGTHRLICRTLKFYDEILTDCGFMRVHKSHLVNLNYVTGYKRGKGGQLSLGEHHQVEVAPSKKAALMAWLQG